MKFSCPEPLEARIAPAVVVNGANHKLATYTDADGDTVTIAITKGDLMNAVFDPVAAGVGEQLQSITLGATFAGTALSITAKRGTNGDGLAQVGAIKAVGVDLGAVLVRGDLGQIDAGDAVFTTPGVASLTVASMGEFGLTTQDAGAMPSLLSDIQGPVALLKVGGNMNGASVLITGGNSLLGSAIIGGSLTGGSTMNSGKISAPAIGTVKIGGDVVGGAAAGSGIVGTLGIASVTITGSLIGGVADSAQIFGNKLGAVSIGGDVTGGGNSSATIFTGGGSLASIKIGGSLTGGSGSSANISSGKDIGAIVIGGDLTGGTGSGSARILVNFGKIGSVSIGGTLSANASNMASQSAKIEADAIGNVRIGGDLVGGGSLTSGAIITGNLGAVFVGGSIVGGGGNNSGFIGTDVLKRLDVRGDVQGGAGQSSGSVAATSTPGGATIGGDLIGGSNPQSGYLSLGAKTGPVRVVGDLIGGSAVSTGTIQTGDGAVSISVGGSLRGSGSSGTGSIFVAGKSGPITVEQDVIGGAGSDSGAIFANLSLSSVLVRGSVSGGTGAGSGSISTNSGEIAKVVIIGNLSGANNAGNNGFIKAGTVLKSAFIGGDLIGGSTTMGIVSSDGSGKIEADRILSLTIGGSVLSGSFSPGSTLSNSGTIQAAHDIGTILIKGDVIGSALDHPVIISAVGQTTPTATTDLAIKSITVLGKVEKSRILAGYNLADVGVNADAQIGAIIANDWVASDAVAGVSATNSYFGDANDVKINEAGESATIFSRIASIVIRNQVYGTVGGADFFGFVAQQIGSLKIGTTLLPFTAAPTQVFGMGPTLDVFAREVA